MIFHRFSTDFARFSSCQFLVFRLGEAKSSAGTSRLGCYGEIGIVSGKPINLLWKDPVFVWFRVGLLAKDGKIYHLKELGSHGFPLSVSNEELRRQAFPNQGLGPGTRLRYGKNEKSAVQSTQFLPKCESCSDHFQTIWLSSKWDWNLLEQ